MLSLDNAILLEGEVSYKDEDVKILMRRAKPLIGNDKYVPSPKPQPLSPQSIKQRKLYLKVDNMNSPLFKRAVALCEIFEGSIPVVIFENDSKRYISSTLTISPSELVLSELCEILGNDSVVLK
jgi:DNA polymerase-3 subunit alpha